ncbi:MAG: hypothetical protein ACTHOR_10075 [Devosia sp.]|jgi:hypothetical protein
MKTLTTAVFAAALAAAALATPAFAQPARVIVRGANPIYVPPNVTYNGDDGYWSNYGGFYGDPLNRYYDPAGAMPDWRYYGPPAVDLTLARTLSRTGDSMLTHILKCQARYPTYSAASNTYYRGGVPVACYL